MSSVGQTSNIRSPLDDNHGMERVDYDNYQHSVYKQARAMQPSTLAAWITSFRQYAAAQRPLAVLDLGSGVGRFTPALADEFGGPVYGIEPSQRMRAIALESAQHPRVTYVEGLAERIPSPDNSCDVVLLYLVLHHIADQPAAAAEISRVLRPGGILFVRSTFADRIPDALWYQYFPRAKQLEAQIFPTVAQTERLFADFETVTLTEVRHEFAASLPEYAERLKLRAISTLEHLTKEELAAGLAALDADAAANPGPQTLEGPCDMLVLRRN